MVDWEAVMSLASLQLTETEHRYYGDIFIYCCENADTDVVPSSKVGELLRSANLPCDVTLKIMDICGGAKNNTLNRKQFYAVLKLVASHQAGLEVHKDLIFASVDELALPRFTWPSSTGDEEEDGKKRFFKKKSKIRSSSHNPESTTESESDRESPRETEGGSTDSPTPTNSVTQERNDGALRGEANLDSITGGWQSLLVSEEQRQLLGTEEESSERHSSDDGEDGESFPPEKVWTISDEQRDYYAAQFVQLQPNPEGLLAGSLARKFFEKSRLPVEELRRIWQLADVTRDSALSLHEFYVAMHLAVLRRNHIPLPDVLPPQLAKLVTVPEASQPTQQPQQPSSVPPVPAPRASPTTRAAATAAAAAVNKEKSKEWTKFVDSPTGTSGASGNTSNGNSGGNSITSPGPKPVNFDFQKSAVERDPKILHPVPLRLTPEAAILASSANGNGGAVPMLGDEDVGLTVHRPLAKKPGMPALPDETVIATPKKEPPPPPPPRPYRTHTRSSSLDLNKLGAPPTVPPRVSPGITTSVTRKLVGQKSEGEGPRTNHDKASFVADFSQFAPRAEENQTVENNVPSSAQQFTGVCGAFHIYKKPNQKRNSQDDATKDETDEYNSKLTLQELREKNAELRQVCEELTKELAGALQERINLRAKLLLLT